MSCRPRIIHREGQPLRQAKNELGSENGLLEGPARRHGCRKTGHTPRRRSVGGPGKAPRMQKNQCGSNHDTLH